MLQNFVKRTPPIEDIILTHRDFARAFFASFRSGPDGAALEAPINRECAGCPESDSRRPQPCKAAKAITLPSAS
jgi:hypothetical protein